jgi:hypothetical protein
MMKGHVGQKLSSRFFGRGSVKVRLRAINSHKRRCDQAPVRSEHEHVMVAIKDAFAAAQRQIKDAFAAAQRQIKDAAREMRGQVKPQ